MQEFNELLEVAEILNSPKGCPWDREQTFQTLRSYILEEAHEVLDAVDSHDDAHLIEELGDLFYTVIFYAKVAEREKRFSLKNIVEVLKAKLIRRHPHVFGEQKVESVDDVIHNWEKIKKEEKKHHKSFLEDIPKTLPSLQRAQKILKRMKKMGFPQKELSPQTRSEELGKKILQVVQEAIEENIDIEISFREVLKKIENHFELQSTQI